MLQQQSTVVGFPGANIAAIKVRRVKRGRVCFCIFAAKSTSVLIHILNTVLCCFRITFKNQRAVHHFQVIRRAVQKAYYPGSRTTADYSVKTIKLLLYRRRCQGLISAIKAGRVTRGRVCFCVLASESTSVLIYILNTVHCCFCITFKSQRAVHHFQVIRRAVQKAYYHCSRTTADYSV